MGNVIANAPTREVAPDSHTQNQDTKSQQNQTTRNQGINMASPDQNEARQEGNAPQPMRLQINRPNENQTDMWVLPEAERGRTLEDFYELPEKEIGRGHYGIVRIGTFLANGEKYAIKSITKRRPVYVRMLRDEVKILQSLEHPNIIKLVEAFEDARTVHLVFEPCYGGELFEPISDQSFVFSERQASRITRKMFLAIKYCHDRFIVHRDLKPENMLLTDPGISSEIKVIDFGLATECLPSQMLDKHVGTPYYIAPEVLDKKYTQKCDLWSAGVILFTLMCAYPPFFGDTEKEIYSRIRRGRVEFEGPEWEHRSNAVKSLIKRLLTRDPMVRVDVHSALADPWIIHEGNPSVHREDRRLLTRLRRYCSFPYIKRLALLIAATRYLSATPDIDRERALWAQFADPDEGHITTDSIKRYLRERQHLLDRGITQREIDSLLRGFDLYSQGIATFTEFIAWCVPRTTYLDESTLVDAFEVLDVDSDGLISISDVKKFTFNLALGGPMAGIEERYREKRSVYNAKPFRKYAEGIITACNLYEGPADCLDLSLDDKPFVLTTTVKPPMLEFSPPSPSRSMLQQYVKYGDRKSTEDTSPNTRNPETNQKHNLQRNNSNSSDATNATNATEISQTNKIIDPCKQTRRLRTWQCVFNLFRMKKYKRRTKRWNTQEIANSPSNQSPSVSSPSEFSMKQRDSMTSNTSKSSSRQSFDHAKTPVGYLDFATFLRIVCGNEIHPF